MAEWIPFGLGVPDLVAGFAGCVAFLSVFAVWHGLLAPDHLGPRLQALQRQREALREGLRAPRRRQALFDNTGLMRQVLQRLDILRNRQTEKVREKLMQAGWRDNDALVRFMFAKLSLPVTTGVMAIFLLYVVELYVMPPMPRLMVSLCLVLLAFYGPDIFVKNAVGKRREKIRKSMPDALDLMVICAEAGLSLDASFNRVARENRQASPELADEFSLCAVELGFLPDRRQALENLVRRCDLPAMRGLVNTLVQTEKYGTPLSHSLRVLAAEFRDERMLRAEEKAARLPATLTVPMIVFILPTLFIVLIGPAILRTIDAFRNI